MKKITLGYGLRAGLFAVAVLLMIGCVKITEAPNTTPVTDTETLPPVNEESIVPDTQSDETSEPNSTQGWQTYTNADYGYSIKYPSAWTVDLKANDSRGKALPTFLAPGMNNAPHDKIVDISVAPTADVEKPDSAARIKQNGNRVISKSPVVVGGVSTDLYITNLNNGYEMQVYVEKNSDTYILALRSATSSDTEYIDTFNLMVSSFEFTKLATNTTVDSTATAMTDWKTMYPAPGMTLQYPGSWVVRETLSEGWSSVEFTDPAIDTYPDVLSVNVAGNNDGITLEEWYQELQKSNWTKVGQTTIGGYTFYALSLPESDAGRRHIGTVGESTTVQGGRTYQATMLDISARLSDADLRQIFDRMIISIVRAG